MNDPTVQAFVDELKQLTGQAENDLLPFATQWAPQVAAWKTAGMTRPVEELAAAAVFDAGAMGVRLQADAEQVLAGLFQRVAASIVP